MNTPSKNKVDWEEKIINSCNYIADYTHIIAYETLYNLLAQQKQELLKVALEIVGEVKSVKEIFPKSVHKHTVKFAGEVIYKAGYNQALEEIRLRLTTAFGEESTQ